MLLANRASRARQVLLRGPAKLALSYRVLLAASHGSYLTPAKVAAPLPGADRPDLSRLPRERGHSRLFLAIEELGLEIRASQKNPSRMPNGTWNPNVKANLEARLHKSHIDLSDDQIWTLRGPKTRIERDRPPPSSGKPRWSRGSVRDANVPLVDALALASWLRGWTTTHRFNERARSLTVYDAHNVQSLARRLIMERFGFWQLPGKPQRQKSEGSSP